MKQSRVLNSTINIELNFFKNCLYTIERPRCDLWMCYDSILKNENYTDYMFDWMRDKLYLLNNTQKINYHLVSLLLNHKHEEINPNGQNCETDKGGTCVDFASGQTPNVQPANAKQTRSFENETVADKYKQDKFEFQTDNQQPDKQQTNVYKRLFDHDGQSRNEPAQDLQTEEYEKYQLETLSVECFSKFIWPICCVLLAAKKYYIVEKNNLFAAFVESSGSHLLYAIYFGRIKNTSCSLETSLKNCPAVSTASLADYFCACKYLNKPYNYKPINEVFLNGYIDPLYDYECLPLEYFNEQSKPANINDVLNATNLFFQVYINGKYKHNSLLRSIISKDLTILPIIKRDNFLELTNNPMFVVNEKTLIIKSSLIYSGKLQLGFKLYKFLKYQCAISESIGWFIEYENNITSNLYPGHTLNVNGEYNKLEIDSIPICLAKNINEESKDQRQ